MNWIKKLFKKAEPASVIPVTTKSLKDIEDCVGQQIITSLKMRPCKWVVSPSGHNWIKAVNVDTGFRMETKLHRSGNPINWGDVVFNGFPRCSPDLNMDVKLEIAQLVDALMDEVRKAVEQEKHDKQLAELAKYFPQCL